MDFYRMKSALRDIGKGTPFSPDGPFKWSIKEY